MCNLYSQTKAQDAMRHVFDVVADETGNLPPLTGIYPDTPAPIITQTPQGRRLILARWGMPTPPQFLLGKRTDPGVTNIRNTTSPHWRRWLGEPQRCLAPFTSFSEIDSRDGALRNHPVWFALGPDRPLACFAGIWVEWTSTRKLKEGQVTVPCFGFLTCDPNREVGHVHPKAMPVILTRPEEWAQWLTAPTPRALELQRPLPDGELDIVAEGTRDDAA